MTSMLIVPSSAAFHYQLGGCLAPSDPSYIKRPADEAVMAAIEAGDFAYVFNARHMGKSSLLARSRQWCGDRGYACVSIDISRISRTATTPNAWYREVVTEVWRGFKLGRELSLDWWRDAGHVLPLHNLEKFIEREVLAQIPHQKIVILIDEIDSVLTLPFPVDDLFALIRFCYNQRSIDPRFDRLSFVMAGVTKPSDLINDPNRTPFSLGRAIDLGGLPLDQATPLASGFAERAIAHGFDVESLLTGIWDWTGGQPFLTQKLCAIVRQELQDLTDTDPLSLGQPEITGPIASTDRTDDSHADLSDLPRHGLGEADLEDTEIQFDEIDQDEAHRQDAWPAETLSGNLGQFQERGSTGQNGNHYSREEQRNPRRWLDHVIQTRIIYRWYAQDTPEHLRIIRDHLLRNKGSTGHLLGLYQQIYRGQLTATQDAENLTDLLLSGVVVRQGDRFTVKNRVYARVFDTEWIDRSLQKLRPYAQPIEAWLASGCVDRSRLLHGRALCEAQAWAEGKRLGDDDYRFLSESTREDQRAQTQALAANRTQEAEACLAAERDRLAQEQRITQRQRTWLGITGLALGVVSCLGLLVGWQAWRATHQKSQGQLDAVRARIAAADGALAANAQLNALVEAIAARATLDQLKSPFSLPWGTNSQSGQRELRDRVDLTLRRAVFMAHERHSLEAHTGGVTDLAWSPNGDLLATVGQDGKVKLWSVAGRLLATTVARPETVASVAWSRDGLSLWATGLDGKTFVFERPTHLDPASLSPQEQPAMLVGRLVADGGPGFSTAVNPAPTLDGVAIAIGRAAGTSVYPLLTPPLTVAPPPKPDAAATPDPANPTDAPLESAASLSAVPLTDPIWEVSDRASRNANRNSSRTLANTPVWNVAFSPDGRELWTVQGDRYHRYDAATGRALPNPITPGDGASQYGLALSPDGTLVATSDANSATLWRSDGQRLYDLPHGDRVWDVVFSPDGRLLATASDDGCARLWTVTGQLIATFQADRNALRRIAFSPDGRLLTTGSQAGTVKFWQWQHPLHHRLTDHRNTIQRVAWWTDGSGFVTVSRDRTVKIWNLNGQVTRTEPFAGNVLDAIAVHPHAQVLALATDRGLSVLDLMPRDSARDPLLMEFGQGQRFHDLAFDRIGHLLSAAQGKVDLWNATNGQLVRAVLSQDTTIHSLAVARDGSIVTGGDDGTVRLHNVAGQGLWTQDLGSPVVDLSWVANEQAIAAVTRDGQVQLWQRSGKLIRRFERDRHPLTRIDASVDGQTVAVGGTDGTLELWNMQRDRATLLPLHQGQVRDLQFSPDGRWLLSAGDDATAVMWDLEAIADLDPLTYACNWVADYLNAQTAQPYAATGIAAAACDRLPPRKSAP